MRPISISLITSCTLFLLLFTGCKQDNSKADATDEAIKPPTVNIVEVITYGMDFNLPDTLKSGWTTFKYINKSYEPHFFILEKMPDSIGIKEYKSELLPPFKTAFQLFGEGKVEAGMKEFEKIPQWFYSVEFGGGVGLTSAQSTTQSTIDLAPGTYVMECYVRMPNGVPHTFMGMLKELTVLEAKNEQSPPKADKSIAISSEEGISFVDSLSTGDYVFSVSFKDQKKYEHMLGHDVNLVKIENDSLLPVLGNWLNSMDMTAFRSPAPEGLTFLGGVEDLSSGSTGYFNVNLSKGDYVLISEIPNSIDRNMYKTFTVN